MSGRQYAKLRGIIGLISAVSCAAANLSMTWSSAEDILDEPDLRLEQEFWNYPAIHSIDNQFRSFLRWHCFPSEELTKTACLDEDGREPRKDEEGNDWGTYDFVAIFESNDRELYFEVEHMIGADECLERVGLFNRFQGTEPVCMYAARSLNQDKFPTDSESDSSDFFFAYGFKGVKGRYLAPTFDPNSEAFIGEREMDQ
jgi:hypothetical protein